jgi:hypothetical protein
MCEAQCASMRSRLERRINRVPATKRQMSLAELIAPSPPAAKTAPTKAAPVKTAAPKKAAAPAPATRKTRAVVPANTITKVTVTKSPTVAITNAGPKHTAVRAKKRPSEEMSSEDKENAALDVPKKRVRAATQKAPIPTKAPTTRTTRAASRQKTAPAAAAILSPKNNNARQQLSKTANRPR